MLDQSMPRAALLVQGGDKDGESIPLGDGSIVIGRSALNDIEVDAPGISRQHAVITGTSSGYTIADLDSRNGTFVNGERIGQEARRLRTWDRIELGGMETHWVFMMSDETIDIRRPE